MRKPIGLLVLLIIALSLIAAGYGAFSNQGNGQCEFKSIYGETITIYGKGLYKNDSVAMASQAIAQDYVTLFMAIPLLLASFYLSKKGLLKGKLLLTGTLGYFLYTYTSYSFLSMYNSMFLIYIMLMSASFFAFLIAFKSFDLPNLYLYFDKKLPVTFIGGFLLFVSFLFGMMWIGKIIPTLTQNVPPVGIDHYTTLVIQAMDLGFVIPAGIWAGILFLKRRPLGYLLGSVLIVKFITLLTALTAMIIRQMVAGIQVGFSEIFIVVLINLLVIYCLVLIMKNSKEPERR
ncbi:hypothetical protein [Neobacillus sp. PS3-40]|uniref:hypothetical protein n=1 Tax=Neobacillus sp. PS3-40 TaxID=3070679 RepID=UPI0027DEAE6A|nr:hypothetical protein [Neobacillus sp. PS3-40]WML42879.1 hypothetical protein RCG20_13680 [Neobacillus sp. PS3-40]